MLRKLSGKSSQFFSLFDPQLTRDILAVEIWTSKLRGGMWCSDVVNINFSEVFCIFHGLLATFERYMRNTDNRFSCYKSNRSAELLQRA